MALRTMKILFVGLFGVLVVFLGVQAWGEELDRLRPLAAASFWGVRDGATARQWVIGVMLPLFPWCGFLGVILVGCVVVVLNEGEVTKRQAVHL